MTNWRWGCHDVKSLKTSMICSHNQWKTDISFLYYSVALSTWDCKTLWRQVFYRSAIILQDQIPYKYLGYNGPICLLMVFWFRCFLKSISWHFGSLGQTTNKSLKGSFVAKKCEEISWIRAVTWKHWYYVKP